MNIHGIQSVGTLTQETGGFATLSGSFTGSFKGDGSQLTGLPSQSFNTSSLLQTASFNAYTASTDGRLSNIESTTASLQGQLTTIGGQSGSWITESETGSFARYDVSNPWSAPQAFTTISASNALITNLTTVYETSSIIYSSGSNQFGDELTDTQTLSGSVKVQGSLTVNGTPVQTSSVDISALNQATASLQAFTQSAQISINALNTNSASVNTSISNLNQFSSSIKSITGSFATTGSNIFTGQQEIVDNPLYVLGQNPFLGLQANLAGSGSQYPFAQITLDTNAYSGSGGSIGAYLVQDPSTNNSVAMGINTYSSIYGYPTPVPMIYGQGALTGGDDTLIAFPAGRVDIWRPTNISGSVNITGSLTASLANGYTWVGNASGKSVLAATSSFGQPLPSGVISSSAQITAFGFVSGSYETTGRNIISSSAQITSLGFVSSSVTASSLITASVNLNTITFTKGDNTTFQLTVNTGSAGGGASFPYTGSAVITGSLAITGSLFGSVITLSVASSTASLDMNAGNMFVLTLPSSSTTHIAATNIKAGQTLNLLLKQQVGPATGSVTWAPYILFPSGLDMVATNTGSAIDLVSMISFDTTNLMAANVKNLA